MASNTKLTLNQKSDLKDTKVAMPSVTLVNNKQTTIAFMVKGNTVEFALSVASPDELKFRRKVGEYFALGRFIDNQTAKMAISDFEAMLFYVYGIYLNL